MKFATLRTAVGILLFFASFVVFSGVDQAAVQAQGLQNRIVVGDQISVCRIEVKTIDDATVLRINDNGMRFSIWEHPDRIEVRTFTRYTQDDLEKLRVDRPDLYMHATSFPKTSAQDEVIFELFVAKTVEAKDVEELEKTQPEAFEVYKRYSDAQINRGGGMGGGIF